MENNELKLNEYQELAQEFAIYPMPVIYPALGITGEAGEVSDKIKKWIRDNGWSPFQPISTSDAEAVALELGDVLWYIAALAHDLGFPLSDIASMNIKKLSSRKKRNAIKGSGDDR